MKASVIYWTGTGNTEIMANAIAEGIELEGCDVETIFVSDATEQDFIDADFVALGCPAMGDEVLEEYEFEPYLQSIEPYIDGKKILLFGSYSWADGQWMIDWVERMNGLGANLVNSKGITVFETPTDDDVELCRSEGRRLVKC